MPAIYNAVDLVTLSSSYGEAFPMVLGEAMSCGKACVSTDVGDADDIIGDTGVLVPIRDADALASGWARLLKETGEERARRSAAARERIVSQFSMARVSESYAHLYQRLSGSVVHPR
jgi:glycosyltransferase involved in cell wall biosynthesis